MKVDPPLFPQSLGQPAVGVRPTADASEARKAFAALLSAANQRSTLPRTQTAAQPEARSESRAPQAAPAPANEPAGTSTLARPGRVLDIRV